MNFNPEVQSRSTHSTGVAAEQSNAGNPKGMSVTSMLGTRTEGLSVDSNQAVASGYTPPRTTPALANNDITTNFILREELSEENEPEEEQCKLSKFEREIDDISINVENRDGNTPLPLAVGKDEIERIITLLTVNATEYANMKNKDGNTPLHLTIRMMRKACFDVLIDVAGIQLELKNAYGEIPLHCASNIGDAEVAEKLLAVKPLHQLSMKNSDGDTPINLAIKKDCKECLNVLRRIEAEAEVEAAQSVRVSRRERASRIIHSAMSHLMCHRNRP